MTKCKHKGECICGKHPKDKIEFVTIGGVDYIQTKSNLGAFGEVAVLHVIEDVEEKPLRKIQIPKQLIKENK